ncbi:hypothetical protein BS50DRAFT_671580 [Corynespora cassiicola Philippines]|uniref:Rhodopsin domain-containing protein n=1 Tax=Corynespora cassiicola Philippines TaxID=1448308 RepID=A0A2T2PCP5_CORCC|nr:hypothetical protein BS50DRAFT_671580 [Corynespora cassiicola Philippines]
MEKCLDPLTMDPNTCPGLVPPEGVRPMDPNAYTLQPYVIATTAVCVPLTVIAVLIRLFTRGHILKRLQLEDYSLLLATAGSVAFIGVINKAFDFNCGKHQWNVSMADLSNILQYINIAQILYSPFMFAAKFGLLLQIKRIFTTGHRDFTYWAILSMIIANAAIYTSTFFAFVFACLPREKIWNPMVEGTCINPEATMIASSAINLASDIAIISLPLLRVLQLQMPLRRKIGVIAIFATGSIACIASLMRLIYTIRLTESKDVTYWTVPAGLWAHAEITTVIICACFPTFPCFIAFLRGENPHTNTHTYDSSKSVQSPALIRNSIRNSGLYPVHSHTDDESKEVDMEIYLQLDAITLEASQCSIMQYASQESFLQGGRVEDLSIWWNTHPEVVVTRH